MNRAELRQLAVDRVADARVLLDNQRWSAAYYLIGYAVETALKACILKLVEETGVIFTDKKFAEKCWTHRIEDLVRQASLGPLLAQDAAASPPLHLRWSLVEQWTETSRYEQHTTQEANDLYDAVTNDPHGVLRWIQQHW